MSFLHSARTTLTRELKRFLKYTFAGGAIGATGAGIGGNLLANEVIKRVDKDIIELKNEYMNTLAHYLIDHFISKLKREGINHCIISGGLFGLGAGSTVAVGGIVFRAVRFVITKRRLK